MPELTDPIAIAIKTVADSVLAGDEALLGVIKELIKRMHELEARIIELELINSGTSLTAKLFDPKTGLPFGKQ